MERSASMTTLLTDEQLDQIADVFGIERKATMKVRDGFVRPTDAVWWWCESGPQRVTASLHMANIKEFPNAYSIKEPRTKVTYIDKEAT
jgi:hypothetical protein